MSFCRSRENAEDLARTSSFLLDKGDIQVYPSYQRAEFLKRQAIVAALSSAECFTITGCETTICFISLKANGQIMSIFGRSLSFKLIAYKLM